MASGSQCLDSGGCARTDHLTICASRVWVVLLVNGNMRDGKEAVSYDERLIAFLFIR